MILGFLHKKYLSRDWVGEWYKILKARGENDMISFVRGRRNEDGSVQDCEKYSFSHSIMDGTSAIPYYLNKFGEPSHPRSTTFKSQLGFFQTLKLIFKNMKVAPTTNTQWKTNLDKKIENIDEFSRLILTKEETQAFKDYCKSQKISENAITLELLNPLIFDLIKNDNQVQTWLFPVNMRGITNKKDPYENHSSFIPLDVTKDSKAIDLHNQMKTKLKSLSYIGIWWVHHIGILCGLKKMSELSYKSSLKNFWIGSFSSVGEWETKSQNFLSLGENEGWFFATPGSKNFPISMVTLTFNGKLCWSLRLHPSISESPVQRGDQILQELKLKVTSLKA